MTTTRTIAAMFSKAVSMEIDAHRPIEYAELFELAHDYVMPLSADSLAQAEELAACVDDLLTSARALA